MMRQTFLLALCASLAACGDSTPSNPTTSDVPVSDNGTSDTGGSDASTDAAGDASADAPADVRPDAPAMQCGMMRPALTGTSGTEGVVIAADGTIYYSQASAVGRITPDGTRNGTWVRVTGATTMWGLALDVPRRRLYAGSPATRSIHVIDLSSDTPSASVFLASAGQPNGLTMGPDGDLYYSDFGGGHVYRVSADGMRTQVTTSTISSANGVAFYNGDLYVDSYSRGILWRLSVSGGMETARMMVASGLGNPDGLAFDATGAAYITDQMMGRLVRIASDGTTEDLLTGLRSPANIEWGLGPLSCTDIYVATGSGLVRYQDGTVNGLDVPWHR
jgi:SMP-30/Gluconolactonase/LRE-like region